MLTKKKLKEIRDEVYKDMMYEYNKAIKLYESGEKNYHKYNGQMLKSNYDYYDIRLDSVEEVEIAIAEAREKYDTIKNFIDARMPVEYISTDDDEYDDASICVKWNTIIDKELLKPKMKGLVLTNVGVILHDYMVSKGYDSYPKSVSCNVLKLFEDDKIDHDMLLELTYTDCALFN